MRVVYPYKSLLTFPSYSHLHLGTKYVTIASTNYFTCQEKIILPQWNVTSLVLISSRPRQPYIANTMSRCNNGSRGSKGRQSLWHTVHLNLLPQTTNIPTPLLSSGIYFKAKKIVLSYSGTWPNISKIEK